MSHISDMLKRLEAARASVDPYAALNLCDEAIAEVLQLRVALQRIVEKYPDHEDMLDIAQQALDYAPPITFKPA